VSAWLLAQWLPTPRRLLLLLPLRPPLLLLMHRRRRSTTATGITRKHQPLTQLRATRSKIAASERPDRLTAVGAFLF
jgi:hypothetical protein